MRNSIGGLWLFSIVITFMMILIAFVAISINYSNAYKLKTAMITKLEEYDVFTPSSVEKLNGLISANGYRQKGNCPEPKDKKEKYFGVIPGETPKSSPTKPQSYCVYRTKRSASGGSEDKYYYTITIFFGFNLPVFGDIYTFRVSGETGEINYPSKYDYFK